MLMKKVIPKKKRIEITKDFGEQNHETWFSSYDIVELLKIKRETLRDWVADGYVEADIKATGTGTKNRFNPENIFQIRLFMHLTENGISREEAGKRVKALRRELPRGLIWDEKPIFVEFTKKGSKYSAILLHGDPQGIVKVSLNSNADEVMVVNITQIIDQVDAVIQQ